MNPTAAQLQKRFLAVFSGIDLRMNGWNSEAPGTIVKSTGNGRGSILGLIPDRCRPGKSLESSLAKPIFPV
jgi:hypothetical protein